MSQFLVAISTWLHTLATIVFIGYYVLLALVYLPAMPEGESANTTGATLSGISKRSRVWLYSSLLVFILTGTYLMLIDPSYLGLMNFGNLWGILMLTKHILVLGMVALGFWFNAILRVGPMMMSNNGASQAIARFRWYVNAMSILGVAVLLLTAFAQVQ